MAISSAVSFFLFRVLSRSQRSWQPRPIPLEELSCPKNNILITQSQVDELSNLVAELTILPSKLTEARDATQLGLSLLKPFSLTLNSSPTGTPTSWISC